MKFWKYQIVNRTNIGTEENPLWHESFLEKRIPCTEANEEIAKKEAYNGEYTIEDDGQPDPISKPTEFEIIDARLTYVEMMTGLLEG
jgi:hypothetical protein